MIAVLLKRIYFVGSQTQNEKNGITKFIYHLFYLFIIILIYKILTWALRHNNYHTIPFLGNSFYWRPSYLIYGHVMAPKDFFSIMTMSPCLRFNVYDYN